MVFWIVRRSAVFFFFFKQKTAYESPKRLEFRRVLFRSPACDADGCLPKPAWCGESSFADTRRVAAKRVLPGARRVDVAVEAGRFHFDECQPACRISGREENFLFAVAGRTF